MLQVADLAGGACFAAFKSDAFGFTEQAYLRALKKRMWCRSDRELWQDELKVIPWPIPPAEQNILGRSTSVDRKKKVRAAAPRTVSLFPATDVRPRTFYPTVLKDAVLIHRLRMETTPLA